MLPSKIIEIVNYLAEDLKKLHKDGSLTISKQGLEYADGKLIGSALGSRSRLNGSISNTININLKYKDHTNTISFIVKEGFHCCGMLEISKIQVSFSPGCYTDNSLFEILFKYLDILCLNFWYTSYCFILSVENNHIFKDLNENYKKYGLSKFNSFLNERVVSKDSRHECILYGKNLNYDDFIVYLHEKNECKKQREQLRETSSTGIKPNGVSNSNNEVVVASLGQSIS